MNFDLHIHSKLSEYKESPGIVDESTVDNVDVLLNKLEEYEVGLFSITDHNRFNVELYNKLDSEIKTGNYEYVKGLVAGVEFDVQIDNDMGKCHIITIFDAKNKTDNYQKIEKAIGEHKLDSAGAFYTRDEFESILKEIGLDVILIACQRNSLDRHDGKHNSLSESTKDSKELIMTGYISALEFQRPNVEGILKNNLRDVPKEISLVMGSDCHDWKAYPNHDKKNTNKQFTHSRAKILPTFKGLLMAITSPETRINQQESKNTDYIDEFKIGETQVKLANGINAIIGENGSGKSTLLNLLNNVGNAETYMKSLIANSAMDCEKKYLEKKLYIGQGDIVQKFDKNTLFPAENFVRIPHDKFRAAYINYAKAIFEYIRKNIKKAESINGLTKKKLEYSELNNLSTYFVQIEREKGFADIENIHAKPKEELQDILTGLKTILSEEYFKKYEARIKKSIGILEGILDEIDENYNIRKNEKNVKNIIISAISNYDLKIKQASSSQEKDQRDFNERRTDFIETIVDAIKKNNEEIRFPEKPDICEGHRENASCGFSFNSKANYNNIDVHDKFLARMFNQDYAKIEKLKKINNLDELIKAVTGCTSYDQLEDHYSKNLKIFLKEMCNYKNYIVDISNPHETLGSTLGEQSLAYFKYITEFENEKCIFLVDQPEDHISNNNISKKLISYLNSIRNKKQVIIVTHNPLLVVNQDVDQVIFVEKHNNKINVTSGCLEFEDDKVNMLDLIAENMDGGKASIEKRLKVYG